MGELSKPCPFCAELIPAAAVKCQFCKSWISGGPANRESRPEVQWAGNSAIVRDGQSLGEGKCVNCGKREGVQPWTQKFSYTPPWVYLGLLAGLLPAAILAAFFTRKASLTFHRCAPCKSKMIRTTLVCWLVGLGGLFAFPVMGALVGRLVAGNDGAGAGVGVGFLVWIVALIVVAVLGAMSPAKCTLIDNGIVTVKIKNPQHVKD